MPGNLTQSDVTPPPAAVAKAFARLPLTHQARLQSVRALILDMAARTNGVGPMLETLKWGEPAYLPARPNVGTTIRLGISKAAPEHCALFVSCNSRLVPHWRQLYGELFRFEGDRALILPIDTPWPEAELRHCIATALTYHSWKRQLPA